MAGLQFAHRSGDAEQVGKKIFEVGRQIDEQACFVMPAEPVGVGSRRHQPIVQRAVARSEMGDKSAVDPDEAVALVEIGERKPVLQDEIGHALLLRE
jgi:hypothetical protein